MQCGMGTGQICTPNIACDGQPDITGHWRLGSIGIRLEYQRLTDREDERDKASTR